MLGTDNARLNELEAENRRLRDELLTQTVVPRHSPASCERSARRMTR